MTVECTGAFELSKVPDLCTFFQYTSGHFISIKYVYLRGPTSHHDAISAKRFQAKFVKNVKNVFKNSSCNSW